MAIKHDSSSWFNINEGGFVWAAGITIDDNGIIERG
jgi:hypothetical protein